MTPHYVTRMTDSQRWAALNFRPNDVILSTPSKCGTTWLQMICALLILDTTELPRPLTELSPWLDMRLRPLEDTLANLEAIEHRRFIKTHTPLDGLPPFEGTKRIVIGRDLLDVAVSMHHHRQNLNNDLIARRIAEIEGRADSPPEPTPPAPAPVDPREHVLAWILDDAAPTENTSTLKAAVHHLDDALSRSPSDPDVLLLHYSDLKRDLERQMQDIARFLDIDLTRARVKELAARATFDSMRADAANLAPDERFGLISDPKAFFRSGASKQASSVLTPADLATFTERLELLASPELRDWLSASRN